jgi:hypothetical protein
MTSFDDDKPNNEKSNNKNSELVPYTPPPPLPKSFTFEFNQVVVALDRQCQKFEALQRAWQKRDYPVTTLNDPNEPSWPSLVSESAQNLLAKLQAFWSDENIHYHTSRKCIGARLSRVANYLDQELSPDRAQSLVDRIEAELPSVMVLESTCRELEDNPMKQFPQGGHILSVLGKQKKLWAKRMAALDLARIEELREELETARQQQYEIFDAALRQRLTREGHAELLAILDVDPDKRVDGCVHFVTVIANLLAENCTELADKHTNDNEEEVWWQAHDEACQTYEEARRVLADKQLHKRQQREMEEYRQKEQEKERQRQREEEELAQQEEEARVRAMFAPALRNLAEQRRPKSGRF